MVNIKKCDRISWYFNNDFIVRKEKRKYAKLFTYRAGHGINTGCNLLWLR